MRAQLIAWWREVVWVSKGIVGANAYEQYLAYHRGTGCTHEPMTEREFWRDKYDREASSSVARCC